MSKKNTRKPKVVRATANAQASPVARPEPEVRGLCKDCRRIDICILRTLVAKHEFEMLQLLKEKKLAIGEKAFLVSEVVTCEGFDC